MKNAYIEECRLRECLEKYAFFFLINIINRSYLYFNSLLLFISVQAAGNMTV